MTSSISWAIWPLYVASGKFCLGLARSQKIFICELDVVVHIFKFSTQEVEANSSLWVWGQPVYILNSKSIRAVSTMTWKQFFIPIPLKALGFQSLYILLMPCFWSKVMRPWCFLTVDAFLYACLKYIFLKHLSCLGLCPFWEDTWHRTSLWQMSKHLLD